MCGYEFNTHLFYAGLRIKHIFLLDIHLTIRNKKGHEATRYHIVLMNFYEITKFYYN